MMLYANVLYFRVPPGEQALARVRSRAEQYKPKTPSGLRASHYPAATAPTPVETASASFGNDQSGRDAQWLSDICPSGDVRKIPWPEEDGLEVDQQVAEIVHESYQRTNLAEVYEVGRRSFDESENS